MGTGIELHINETISEHPLSHSSHFSVFGLESAGSLDTESVAVMLSVTFLIFIISYSRIIFIL